MCCKTLHTYCHLMMSFPNFVYYITKCWSRNASAFLLMHIFQKRTWHALQQIILPGYVLLLFSSQVFTYSVKRYDAHHRSVDELKVHNCVLLIFGWSLDHWDLFRLEHTQPLAWAQLESEYLEFVNNGFMFCVCLSKNIRNCCHLYIVWKCMK